MMRIAIEERRARVAVRHRLSPGAQGETPLDAARAVVALHSTDPATVFLSTWARTDGFSTGDVERALYEDRSLVRMLGMRRTLSGRSSRSRGRRRRGVHARDRGPRAEAAPSAPLEAAGIDGEPAGWIAERLGAALEALESAERRSRPTSRSAVPDSPRRCGGRRALAHRGDPGPCCSPAGRRGRDSAWAPPRVLGRGQYRWAPIRAWLGTDLERIECGGAGRASAALAGRVRAGERDGYPLVDGVDGPGDTRRAGRRTARHGRAGQRERGTVLRR